MSSPDIDTVKRARVMRRSMALGHCVCDPSKPCPCPIFKSHNVCECAGERLPLMHEGPVRLTEHIRSAGCASKVSRKVLREVLKGLPPITDPRVIVGSNSGDDAGVIMISKDTATVLTVDVFTPTVDDPYTFGQIAAANSVSDIYAMGATPQSALSIIGFPSYKLPPEVMREILRGGIEKLKEAGIDVVGGHSINDEEIKCGFAVIGTAPADQFVCNSGAEVGDLMIVTKPLGNGIISFAQQVGRSEKAWSDASAHWMTTLNKIPSELLREFRVHALTDITGFSLTGHLAGIVENSKVAVELDFDALPLLPGVQELACQEVLPGAIERNRESVSEKLIDYAQLTPAQMYTLFCPETSGGLLVFIHPDDAPSFAEKLNLAGFPSHVVGRVVKAATEPKITALSTHQSEWQSIPLKERGKKEATPIVEENQEVVEPQMVKACCASPSLASRSSTRPSVANAAKFANFMGATMGEGAIDLKHKKLMALALSVAHRCGPCIESNMEAARENGATDAEISEAVAMGVAFGGASAMMYYNNL